MGQWSEVLMRGSKRCQRAGMVQLSQHNNSGVTEAGREGSEEKESLSSSYLSTEATRESQSIDQAR